jgi:hypothetical protein
VLEIAGYRASVEGCQIIALRMADLVVGFLTGKFAVFAEETNAGPAETAQIRDTL